MILYYAMGGGLGHLTRARAFLHTQGLDRDVLLLTASQFAGDRRVVGGLEVLRVPEPLVHDPAGYRGWLCGQLAHIQPRQLFLDAFPAGLLGELCDMPLPSRTEVHHLARLLNWDAYAKQLHGTPPQLQTTFYLEPLPENQRAYLIAHSNSLTAAPPLLDPPAQDDPRNHRALAQLLALARPVWLIVHTGGSEELLDLIAYARETANIEHSSPKLVLVAPIRPENLPPEVSYLDLYPASLAYPHVDRVICAAGFNSVRQTEPYRAIRRLVPMPRRYDDQFCRAKVGGSAEIRI